MRIYNNTDSQLEFDLTPKQKIVIQAKSYSCNFLPTAKALDDLVVAFTPDKIAFLVSNTVELSLCQQTRCNTTGNYVCGSFDEVAEKFGLKQAEAEEESKPAAEEKAEVKIEEEKEVEGAVLKEKVIEPAPETDVIASEPVEDVVEAPAHEPESTKKSSRKKKKD